MKNLTQKKFIKIIVVHILVNQESLSIIEAIVLEAYKVLMLKVGYKQNFIYKVPLLAFVFRNICFTATTM